MPEASGIRRKLIKNPLIPTVVASTVGWWAVGSATDPPRALLTALVGVGLAGVGYFSLRPRLRRPHSSSSLPLFPVLVVA